jgi:endo-1,4-beta-mannosidase
MRGFRSALLAAALLIGLFAAPATGADTAVLTRHGTVIYDGTARWRGLGVNLWRAAAASWNIHPATSYDLNDGTALANTLAAVKAAAPAANVIRVWFAQQFALNHGAWDWAAFNKVLSVAGAYGFRVIPVLEDEWYYDGHKTLGVRWYSGGYRNRVLRYNVVPYRQYVRRVAARYAGDPRIAWWELINEPDVGGTGSCPANAGQIFYKFVSDVAGLLKATDPAHLVSIGSAGEVCGQNGPNYSRVNGLPTVDVASFHDYTGAANADGTWGGGNGLDDSAARAAALRKPIYVGECGIKSTTAPVNGHLAARAGYFGAKMAAQFGYRNLAAYLIWQFDLRGEAATGDGYVLGPKDPALRRQPL